MDESEVGGRVIPSRTTDPITSHLSAAEASSSGRAGTQQARLLDAFCSVENATDDQAQEIAGLSETSCYWKRCSELREMGLIEPVPGLLRKGRAGALRIVSQFTSYGLDVNEGRARWPKAEDREVSEVGPSLEARKVAALERIVATGETQGLDDAFFNLVRKIIRYQPREGEKDV